MAKTRKVYVVAHRTGFRVYPPAVVLGKGGTLKIVNVTNLPWDWSVENVPFGREAKRGKVGKGETATVLKVPQRVDLQSYDYAVTRANGRKRAKGNSDPIIIIDPGE